MKRLIDKVVVVTGASRGIGRAIAEAFAREGARVVLAARHLDPLREVERQIVARRGRAHSVACDVTSEADVARLAAETIKRYDGLDIWVNNAGVSLAKALIDTTTDDYARVLDTNLKGVYLGSREAFTVMRARAGGTILNMASVAGKDAWAGLGLYSASKFAVVGLSRALADEGSSVGIRVSALCPGAVNTGVLTGVDATQLIQPEDVADAALYLVTLPRNVEVREMVLDRREAR